MSAAGLLKLQREPHKQDGLATYDWQAGKQANEGMRCDCGCATVLDLEVNLMLTGGRFHGSSDDQPTPDDSQGSPCCPVWPADPGCAPTRVGVCVPKYLNMGTGGVVSPQPLQSPSP